MAPDTGVWSLDDLMLPILQKYECTALLALCDTQLALQSTLLSSDPTSPTFILKLLTLASRFQLHELQQMCTAWVLTKANDPDGRMLLMKALADPKALVKVINDLAEAGHAQVMVSIAAQGIPEMIPPCTRASGVHYFADPSNGKHIQWCKCCSCGKVRCYYCKFCPTCLECT